MIQRSEADVMKNWQKNSQSPVVSICCATFNHMSYISEAIDSFLIQETNFPFEIIVHDDASTDGTTKILNQYKAVFPNILTLITQTENQYSKIPIIVPRFLWPIAKGKYIAMCEGDDYWLAADKLQKQVNFLEKNPDYSMYAHAVRVQDDLDKKKSYKPYIPWSKKTNHFVDILKYHFIPTLSLMFINDLKDFPFNESDFGDLMAGDMALELYLSTRGLCFYDEDVMGVYRHHDGGVTKQKRDSVKILKYFNLVYKRINEFTGYEHSEVINEKLCEKYIQYSVRCLREGELSNSIRFFYKSLTFGIRPFVRAISNKIQYRMKTG